MGAIDTAIAAIVANGSLTRAQKWTQISQARANGINALLAGHLPFVFTQGVWSVTVTAATVAATSLGYAISITVTVTKSGVAQTVNNPLIFINPPVLVDDPAGTIVRTSSLPAYSGGGTFTRTYREDAAAALRQIVVAELIRQLGA